ncbi:hypothetical protein GCM10022214_77700 [Actinomadura miaoliensis]|uniref:Uncharacterized protein n=1 Tax=Actinomadura miaoliensis TaxID=430685 RepID=A0ABP7WZD5_9ACTN
MPGVELEGDADGVGGGEDVAEEGEETGVGGGSAATAPADVPRVTAYAGTVTSTTVINARAQQPMAASPVRGRVRIADHPPTNPLRMLTSTGASTATP